MFGSTVLLNSYDHVNVGTLIDSQAKAELVVGESVAFKKYVAFRIPV